MDELKAIEEVKQPTHMASEELTEDFLRAGTTVLSTDDEMYTVFSTTDRGIGFGAQDNYKDTVTLTLTDEEATTMANNILDVVAKRKKSGIVYPIKITQQVGGTSL